MVLGAHGAITPEVRLLGRLVQILRVPTATSASGLCCWFVRPPHRSIAVVLWMVA